MQNGSPDPVECIFSSEISIEEIKNDLVFGMAVMTANRHLPLSHVIDQFSGEDALVQFVNDKIVSAQKIANCIETHQVKL